MNRYVSSALALMMVACGGGVAAVGTSGGGGGDGGALAEGGAGSSQAGTGGLGAGPGGGGAAPEKTFLAQYPLEAAFPEGGIYDASTHAFYMGSLADGSVHRVDATTGDDTTLFTETAPGAWWTLGMDVDVEARRLWVCAMEDLSDTNADPPYDGYLWLFDLDSGEREAVFPLAEASPEATCTDVAVAADGSVYVTDRDFGQIYRATAADGPYLFTYSDLLEASIVGQNAAVVLPDQSALLVAIYLPSRLVRVDLQTAEASDVDIDGSFADLTFLSGADGMTLHEGDLYVAFASELVKLSPTLGDWSTATATEVTVPNGMTEVVSTPHGLYLQNGQSIRYALGQDPDPFRLTLFTGDFPDP